MEMHLKEKIALITGSTVGIGSAITIQLLNEGTTVFINGRTKNFVDKVPVSIRKVLPNSKVDGAALRGDFGVVKSTF
ncbi:short chain dehydrogenase family protein [Leptospira inadai serovar Lyme str. 10]|uniref:Short chain dehydrogenase family protein n=2 Tax=Leptospira inadai serovar Lyme TaxID=293084 RepID=V6HGW1_9LEPT|nr:short chain dehydrogenase family protein [Leptospira inadai]EQA34990.1 short chain dehydrogenase family protein [Leptospira inadai serovar Lyme str. 10]PNV75885.1 oxidoreductase [Leptospira inadai serovar Lyme]